MPSPDSDPRRQLMELWREATERLGLSESHPVCQDIARLSRYWSDALYDRVMRVIERLRAQRDAALRASDRVPPPDAFDGDILIGAVPTPSGVPTPVRFSPFTLLLHTILAGLPGKGKTWLCRLILSSIVRLYPHVCILVFDPNRSYADFCSDPRLWVSVPWRDVKQNPVVPPPGYPEEMWLSEKVDIVARGELMHSKYLISARLDQLVAEAHGAALITGEMLYPSLYDLRDNLAEVKAKAWSREEQYRQSALNVLDGRLRSTAGVYDCARGIEPLITNTRVRIDTQGLAPVESLEYFVTNLIHYVHRVRGMAPLVEPPQLHTLIVIEEAQTIVERRMRDQIASYQEMLLRSRALGVGLLMLTQDISRIDPIVLAACSNYFIFGQSTVDNKRAAEKILDLSKDESGLLSELGVGECFVRFAGHPRWPHAFTARILDHV